MLRLGADDHRVSLLRFNPARARESGQRQPGIVGRYRSQMTQNSEGDVTTHYQDALAVLGLAGKSLDELDEEDELLLSDLNSMENRRRKKALKSKVSPTELVYKRENEQSFYIAPRIHKAKRERFYAGPPSVLTKSRIGKHRGYTPRALVRRSLGLPDVMTYEEYRMSEPTPTVSVRQIALREL